MGVELDLADEFNLAWEAEVIKVMTNSSLESFAETGVRIYINVARRYRENGSKAADLAFTDFSFFFK